MNETLTVMQWVTKLPEVSDAILKARDGVIALVREADEFALQSTQKRAQAYRAALDLESRIRGKWTDAEIYAAINSTNR